MTAPQEGDWGTSPPDSKSRQKFSKKNGIEFVGYTFRLKNYVKVSPPSFGFFRAGATNEVRLSGVGPLIIIVYIGTVSSCRFIRILFRT